MNEVLVKFVVDLYAPGAVIRPTEIEWMNRWDKFHSRRTVYPNKPLFTLASIEDNVWIAQEDFFHIRISSLDGEYGGVMDSELDFSLANTTLDVLLGDQLRIVVQTALIKAPPFNPVHRSHIAWLELWDAKTMESVCGVDFQSIVELCKK
jgi:hypothetical protein